MPVIFGFCLLENLIKIIMNYNNESINNIKRT
jgi:hypothetical protein